MTTDPAKVQWTIRVSRIVSLTRAIALGSSITIGLGIFILMGFFLQQAGAQVPHAYLAAAVLFVPIALIYAERSAITPGSGGPFALARVGGLNWRTFLIGWLLLGGHLVFIALLGWGCALYLGIGLEHLLDITLNVRWLAPIIIVIVALNDLIGTQGGWRLRTLIIYSSMLLLLVIVAWSWLWLSSSLPSVSLPDRSTLALLRIVALMAASLWGLLFVLDSRDELRQVERSLLPALLTPLWLSGIIGVIVAITEVHMTFVIDGERPVLAPLATYAGVAGSVFFEIVTVSFGVLISLIALDRAMVTMLRLIGAMARDGFLPEQILVISPGFGTPLIALRILTLGSALAAALLPTFVMVGLVALAFLWTTGLLNIFDIMRLIPQLPEERRLKLPAYPLFPLLAGLICLTLSSFLPLTVILVAVGWLLVGGLYYTRYGYTGTIAARRRESVVGEMTTVARHTVYTVLIGIANPETAPALIHAGVRLVRPYKGRVLVLGVATFPDQVPYYIQRQFAREQLNDLQALIQSIPDIDVPIEPLVRLAQRPVDGILGTAHEEKVDLILLGWEGQRYDPFDLGPLLDPVVRMATCDVVVLRGMLSEHIRSVLVPTIDSPNSIAAIKLAQNLFHGCAGHVVAMHLVQEALHVPNYMEQAQKRLQEIVQEIGGNTPVDVRVIAADDIVGEIVKAAPDFDILLLGASQGGILDQDIFGGLPVEVARQSPRPVLLVKHYEGTRRFWLRRAWEILSEPFPSLPPLERSEIYHQMRRAAHPSVDFFILITLSAMIASLGVFQSSPAVIIGAMLVAPLMSPILSMGMSIVQGDLRMLRVSARSTLSGIALAMSVSIIMTFVTPTPITTTEILARTRPNLLDLLVALASGAAGGYAIARKEVASALPGVAIAAALVPPLCVVGYGIAVGQLEIAGGSLLLFTTNLLAIVVSASMIFLLLGFRPTHSRLRKQVRLKFLLFFTALIMISLPLWFFSSVATEQITRQKQVEHFFNQKVDPQIMQISHISVEQIGEDLVIYATIYALAEFTPARVTALENELSATLDIPVDLRVTVLQAVLLPHEVNNQPAPGVQPEP